MRKDVKGITLVALVITIIILLILAGITIAQLTGSGLFENAKLAKEKSDQAQIEEESKLSDYENKIGEYIDGTRDTVNNKYDYQNKEEKVIGTWYDGKTLYEVSIPITGPTVTKDGTFVRSDIDLSQYNPDVCIVHDGYWYSHSYDYDLILSVPYWEDGNGRQIKLYYEQNEQLLVIYTNAQGYSGASGYVTLHYTKKD